MRGASHESLARAEEALAGVTVTEELGTELFSIARLLDSNGALRRALTDPARSTASRASIRAAGKSGTKWKSALLSRRD